MQKWEWTTKPVDLAIAPSHFDALASEGWEPWASFMGATQHMVLFRRPILCEQRSDDREAGSMSNVLTAEHMARINSLMFDTPEALRFRVITGSNGILLLSDDGYRFHGAEVTPGDTRRAWQVWKFIAEYKQTENNAIAKSFANAVMDPPSGPEFAIKPPEPKTPALDVIMETLIAHKFIWPAGAESVRKALAEALQAGKVPPTCSHAKQ